MVKRTRLCDDISGWSEAFRGGKVEGTEVCRRSDLADMEGRVEELTVKGKRIGTTSAALAE